MCLENYLAIGLAVWVPTVGLMLRTCYRMYCHPSPTPESIRVIRELRELVEQLRAERDELETTVLSLRRSVSRSRPLDWREERL